MRVLVAPDKFKGCLSAAEVAQAIAEGIQAADPAIAIDRCPLADGGEGTVSALVAAGGGQFITCNVTGPLPDMRVDATFGMLAGNVAVIEMAAASGLALLRDDERNPMRTTTYGTGELLVAAARHSARKIILGIGGSATVDAGIGCAQACGLPVILDGEGPADPREPLVGEDLGRVVLIKHGRGSPVDHVVIEVASDVTNPLYGPNGAAHVFGPQKGATPRQVAELDGLLRKLATKTRCDDIAQRAGAGAAGGLGFALMAFFNATLRAGFDVVAQAVNLRDRIVKADLCMTGEGRLDASSLGGKAPISLARLCLQLGKPCIALVGSLDAGLNTTDYLAATYPISDPGEDLAASISQAGDRLTAKARQAICNWMQSHK